MKEMGTPEHLAQLNQGPVGMVTILPNGPPALGKNLAVWFAFSILISVGISFRHRPALHKRAMLLAFIALVGPALARIARFPVFAEVGLAFVPVTHSSLMLAIWVHDLFADKRVHATTAWGSAAILGLFMASAALARTESGKALVAAISFGGG